MQPPRLVPISEFINDPRSWAEMIAAGEYPDSGPFGRASFRMAVLRFRLHAAARELGRAIRPR